MTHVNGHRPTQRVDSSRTNSRAAEDAARILQYARAEIGFREGASNANKYAAFAGHANNQFWCSTFVTWALKKAGQDGAQLPAHALRAVNSGQAGAAVETFRDAYQAAGKVYRPGSQTPQPGDLVFFGGDGGSHIGIVERVQGGKVYTIEGNSSDSVARRSYDLNGSSIWGFGRTFGESIPPDAQLGGPAELQASVGGGSWTDGGGSTTGTTSTSGSGSTGSTGSSGSTGASGSTGSSTSSPVAQSLEQSSYSGGSDTISAMLFQMLLDAVTGGASVDDIEEQLKKMFPNLSPEQIKALAKGMKENPELARALKAKPEIAGEVADALKAGGMNKVAGVLRAHGLNDEFAVAAKSEAVEIAPRLDPVVVDAVDPSLTEAVSRNRTVQG